MCDYSKAILLLLCFHKIGVSTLKMAIAPKHVGTFNNIHNVQNCAFVITDKVCTTAELCQCDTSAVTLHILWYKLIPHKARVGSNMIFQEAGENLKLHNFQDWKETLVTVTHFVRKVAFYLYTPASNRRLVKR